MLIRSIFNRLTKAPAAVSQFSAFNLSIANRISTNCSQLNQRTHSGELQDLGELAKRKKEFFSKVNGLIEETKSNRAFAVIHMYGYQHLVHVGDVIQIQKDIPARLGERIKLEKCLLAGNDSITLVGRPLLDRSKVNVEVTPIEKTQSYTINRHIITKRQRGKKKHRYHRNPITFIRINEITINKD